MARVAVEDSLGNVKEELQNNGHEVVNMQAEHLENSQYCVISGQDKNVMGMADALTGAAVINAEGLSTKEVMDQINQRIH